MHGISIILHNYPVLQSNEWLLNTRIVFPLCHSRVYLYLPIDVITLLVINLNMFPPQVILVRACSERFLSDLESRWQESVRLTGITDIIRAHAKENFQVYVKYCSNQVYQDRTLKRLKLENPKFVEALKELESSSACQSLAMHSFLMLPMQRITRLPLLTDAIASRYVKCINSYY